MNMKANISRILCAAIFSGLMLISESALALPSGGTVVSGSAAINSSGNAVEITQNSPKAIINWQSFDTSAQEQVRFIQPGVSAIALNRITSGMPTVFSGILSANGQVWVINPAGVLFTRTSRVDVGGLLATTLNISNEDFNAGNYHFQQVPGFDRGAIINDGEIIAREGTFGNHGFVALVAPGVENNGVIQANLGKVTLASGTAFTLDLYGDNLINFSTGSAKVTTAAIAPDGRVLKNAVANNGEIHADGGQVLLTANTAVNVVDNVVSMNGVIEARTVSQGKNGVIILGGDEGTVNISGNIDVSAKDASGDGGKIIVKGHKSIISGTLKARGGTDSGNGGFIETSGDELNLAGVTLDLAATNGIAGTWYIDPYNINIVPGSVSTTPSAIACVFVCTISYSAIADTSLLGADLINGALGAGVNVIISATNPAGTQNGDITIEPGADIFSTTSAFLTMNALGNINIYAPVTIGGTLTLNAGGSVGFNAPTSVGGNLQVISHGDVTQTAALMVGGNVNINSNNHQIILANLANDFSGNLTLSGSNIEINNNAPLLLNNITATGDASFTAAGDITQVPASIINISGNSEFNAGSHNIILNNASNDFVGRVSLNTMGTGNAEITDINNINLNNSSIGGDLNLHALLINLYGNINTGGNMLFNAPVVLKNNIQLAANNGDINLMNGVTGSAYNLMIANARNVFSPQKISVNNFTQQSGTGSSNFSGGLTANNNITVFTQNISGKFTANNTYLSGILGMTGNVHTQSLLLNGSNGGNFTGTINNISGPAAASEALLAQGATGAFYVNGRLVTGYANNLLSTIGDNATQGLNSLSASSGICTANGCSPNSLGNNALRLSAGTVFCMMGFASAVDADGDERILMPGDTVYLDETLVTDKDSSLKVALHGGGTVNLTGAHQYAMQKEN